ncbi:MAG: TetR/AcrR family transcriptional regulator [Bacteroidales bacterium]|nr:TetR/AcrR family transcriptional regulator [Bacteroidales bacterium]
MPKQTFFNLPEEKRQTIMRAAMEEFASAGYDLSSIQKIIKASDIPRGSFYQYFENKADLFGEVMVEITRRKMVYIRPVIDRDAEYGLFELMKELVKAGVEFGMCDPIAFQVAKGLSSSKTLDMVAFLNEYKKEIYQRNHITEESIYLAAIQNSLGRGEIDSRFSVETILAYTGKIMESMGELYWHHLAEYHDVHAGDHILDDMIHILRYGLSSNNLPGKEAGNHD